MNPIPLTHKGRVYAYACGRCHLVHAGACEGHRHGVKTIAALAAHFREQAEACCRCHECKAPLDGERGGKCPPCEGKRKTEFEAIKAKQRAEEEAKNESVKTATSAEAAAALAQHMSDISEVCWAAGWMEGTEYSLWEMLQGGPREWGMCRVSHADIGRLRDLHEESGGWWIWGEQGQRFVTAAEWLKIYEGRHAC